MSPQLLSSLGVVRRRRRVRLALRVAVSLYIVAFLLPVSGVSSATTHTGLQTHRAARPSTAPRCLNVQLLIQAVTSDGAAGSIGIIYRIHNMFGQACTLTGYPGVRLLDRSFLSLPTVEHRGAGGLIGPIPVRLITIPAFGNAYFALGYSDVQVNNRPCQPQAHYVLVIPPNDRLPVVTYAAENGGTIFSCTANIYVSPVTPKPRYR